MATTYNNLYLDARKALRQAGVEEAQLEARELLCFAADKGRNQFFRDMNLYVSEQVEKRFREVLDRRLRGEPVAYIIGEWEFYGLPLTITKDVLIPRADTETLADRGIVFVKDMPDQTRVLDLCAGSGCVGLAVASSCPNTRVILADWSEAALAVCKQNVRRCDLTAQVSVIRANALEPPAENLWDFDIILCNPPYIPTGDLAGLDPSVRDYEPHMALDGGEDGLDFFRGIAAGWKSALRPGGKLVFEIAYNQATAVEYILAGEGYEDIRTFRDPAGNWRVVEGILPELRIKEMPEIPI